MRGGDPKRAGLVPRSRYVSFALPCGALYASFTGFCALGAHFCLFFYKASAGLFEALRGLCQSHGPAMAYFAVFRILCEVG